MIFSISYIIQAHIIFIILLGVYHFLLRNDTNFKFNRIYLLSIVVFALVIPLLSFPVFTQTTILIFPELTNLTNPANSSPMASSLSVGSIIAIGYCVISLLFIISKVFRFLKLFRQVNLIKRKAKFESKNGVYIVENEVAPFSFLKWSFIPQSILAKEGGGLIIAHEKLHARELHSLDIIFTELACCFLFINPLNKLFKKHIIENHEYRADEIALQNDTDSKYKQLLIEQTLYPTHLKLVSSFAKPLILNRLMMMMKKRKQTIAFKMLAIVSTALVLTVFSCDFQEKESLLIKSEKDMASENDNNKVFTIVEDQAEPKEGIDHLNSFLSEKLKNSYPAQARRLGIEGTVYVQFNIEKDGSLSNITAVKGIGAGCDQVAVDALAAYGQWTPGKQNGQVVRSQRVVPIRFTLE
ncbi:TonB family protein [Marivirga sp. S37H4]|uniref:TonB family protein n=1 Tax=Marivirga aurantiaca TaxID=2802615 RepID=A0A934WXW5_9BACT|nr:M56 family metallopeptidase [Marivirga aurantiaca]MBK6264815.1 TonB family protein [Marivirga aurantiaca]